MSVDDKEREKKKEVHTAVIVASYLSEYDITSALSVCAI